ncbi:hypothetical protein C8T65DRAFT_670078 [Cerioporus squamosus]|nr:hypothetical protein C8T65DRAFT_670078 [Cerioporus squamosus]
MTVAVGGMTTCFMRWIVHGILRRCEELTSIAVRDFDATVRSEPHLLVEWAASQKLTRFVIDYTPVGDAGTQGSTEEGWRSDEMLRGMVLPSVRHLEVYQGPRQVEDTDMCAVGFHRMDRRSRRRRRRRIGRPRVCPQIYVPHEKCWMGVLRGVFCEATERVRFADTVPACRKMWRATYAPLEYLEPRRPLRRIALSIKGGGTDEQWDEYAWKVQQYGSNILGEIVVTRGIAST